MDRYQFMRKLPLIFILFFSCLLSSGQTVISDYSSLTTTKDNLNPLQQIYFLKSTNKLFNGKIVTKNSNSDTIYFCSFKNGKKNGKEIKWYETAPKQKWSEYYWKENIVIMYCGWSLKGTKFVEWHLNTGKITEWWPNGNLRTEGYQVNGLQEGKTIHYYESGKIQSIEEYKNGKLVGKPLFYNEDGTIKTEN